MPSPKDARAPQSATSQISVIPLVCFEDTLGRVARRFARPEPQFLVNVTNDAWFLDSAGADQHLANAVFRTIELRRPMLRSANTGVTAVIDPLGRITHRLPRLQSAQLTATIPTPNDATTTLYARFGDAFSIALLGLAATMAALTAASHFWPRLRKESL
jgi:apolipoprotein N-acyltransferase